MGKLKILVAVFILFICVINSPLFATVIYLNSYVKSSTYFDNYVFKIDLDNRQVLDSLNLNIDGEFMSKIPIYVTRGNRAYLISILTNGISGKNSMLKGYVISYYSVIDANNLNMIFQDSLINRQLSRINQIRNDTLVLEWIDDEVGGGWFEGKFVLDERIGNLRQVHSRPFVQDDYSSPIIGNYNAPKFVAQVGCEKYYWGYQDSGDSSYVNIIKVNSDTTIAGELRIGERRTENIISGFSPQTGRIYSFVTPYKLLSYYPLIQSPDYVNAEILIIDPVDLTVDLRIPFDMGEAYAAQETGTAESIGPYVYYYYFMQDGYGRFDPAYLLIFDTRTNQADWLRVGWR